MAKDDHLVAGPTGRFPAGKINPDDAGELRIVIAISEEKQVIVINFGRPTAWLALEPAEAIELADDLLNKANKLNELKGENES